MHSGTTGLAIALGAILALSGCEDGNMPAFLQGSGGGAENTSSANRSTRSVERDVEAPEIFQVSDKGLWDGRPSLGGVWVAHPDATNPERVIIRNESNQKFVVGVLYRPERQQPGPAFQVSSDAADALEMLAGSPATISVTALKREETAAEPDTQVAAAGTDADAPTAAAAAPDVSTSALDPVAAASVALDRVEGRPGAVTSPDAISASLGGTAAAPATPTAPPRAAAPAATAPAGNLSKAYIQIGIFSVEQNANNTAESMRRAGMVPTVKPGKTSGKDFWRVVVGPASSTGERAQLLKKIKDLGFNDAYFVSN